MSTRPDIAALLLQVLVDCSEPNHDGYGADPVSKEAMAHATRFLMSLPEEFALPSAGCDPDGDVTLDWIEDRNTVMSISVSPRGTCAFAWHDGERRGSGHFKLDDVPADFITLLSTFAKEPQTFTTTAI